MNHILKTDPDAFEEVKSGQKTCEIRWNDRGFQVGDLLTLRKTLRTSYQNAPGVENPFTEDDPIVVEVTHAIYGPRYGIADGWACLSIKAIKTERTT